MLFCNLKTHAKHDFKSLNVIAYVQVVRFSVLICLLAVLLPGLAKQLANQILFFDDALVCLQVKIQDQFSFHVSV